MHCNREDCPLRLDAPETVRRIRAVLDRAGYTEAGFLETFQVPDLMCLPTRRHEQPLLLHRARGGTPLETLLRLFFIGVPVDVDEARRAIQPMSLDDWVAADLLEVDGAQVSTTVELFPFRGILLAGDTARSTARKNRVMGFGRAPVMVANLTVRRPSRRTLDLGSGNGIHAFLAAPHSDQVVGVDLNPRAVNLAAFNAQLNGLAHVQFLEGDFFEPVRRQAFDLVVSNPPYLISPEMDCFITDSGLPGDQLCQKLIREVPPLLQEGGFCQFQCEWAHVAGQDWQQRLAGWFAGTGCDAWVMRYQTRDPGTYASDWIRELETESGRLPAERFNRWLAYFAQHRIEALSSGWITMRRATGRANWFRCEDAPVMPELAGPCGEAILRGFALRDFLETVRDDRALLETRLRVSPELRWEEHRALSLQGWTTTTTRLHLSKELTYAAEVDPNVVALVGRCRGDQLLRDVLTDLAAGLGQDLESIAPACLQVARPLVEQGFLLPA